MVFGKKGRRGVKPIDTDISNFRIGKSSPSSKDLFNVGKNAPEIPTGMLKDATSGKRNLRKIGRKEGNRLERIAKRGI